MTFYRHLSFGQYQPDEAAASLLSRNSRDGGLDLVLENREDEMIDKCEFELGGNNALKAASLTIRATCGNCRHWGICLENGTQGEICEHWRLHDSADGNFRAALKEEIDREMTRLLATPNAGESNNGEKPDRGN
ncbi:MAG: hypothetical protein II943_03620 [Victivallales bacterium]|nr:hypothetical protein [Victivallales bacterium]